MRGFGGFEEFIRERGGIVSRRELLSAGWTADELRIAQGNHGRPMRLRRGWYCSSDVPAVVREAWQHGGPLACVSALRWYGVAPSAQGDDEVHICMPRHAKRRAVVSRVPKTVVRHWYGTDAQQSSRWAVPLEVAMAQARRCPQAWAAATAAAAAATTATAVGAEEEEEEEKR